jgi:hypothetical protein
MIIHVNRYWLLVLLVIARLSASNAQTSLTLTYGDPSASADTAFDGNVFQAGSEFGDARFFAKFGGSGTRYFEIDSPGENTTRKVSSDGYVSIRPVASMVIDQSKIKGFTGLVSGSLVVVVKPLSVTTINTNVTTEVVPGSEIIVNYRTGSGTFPKELTSKKFSVQLLSPNGVPITDLLNVTDQYSAREKAGSSLGGIRSIKATIPTSTTSGSYQVRVITQGLIANVVGSASSSFTVKANTPTVTAITANSIAGNYCAGSTVSFPFSTMGTFPTGNAFKVQLINANGSILQDLPSTSLSSPISTTLPNTLITGTYRFQIAATATNVVSNTSTIGVLTFPSMTISGSSTIAAGETAPIRLDFTGTPPWSVTYTDNTTTRIATSFVNSTTITPTFQSSTTYDKSFIKSFSDNICGVSSQISGSAQITTISQLTITTGALSGSYCPGATIPVPFTINGAIPAGVTYEVQLSDATGSFAGAQSLGTGGSSPISVLIPSILASGTSYRVQVVIQKPTTSGSADYSRFASSVASPLFISRPDLPKVADLSICSGTTTTPLSATGTNLKWYLTGSSSQSLTSAPTPPNDKSSIYYVSQTVNGCESARQPISVSVVAAPSAPVVNSVTLCQGTPGQFATSLSNVLWYSAATGGVGSPQPPVINSQTAGELTIYVSQTVIGCESPRVAVKATVYSIPAAPTLPTSATFCQFSTPGSLTATGSGLIWYGQSGKLTGAPTPGTSLSGTQSYSVTQTANGCESLRASVNIVITTAPAPPIASSPKYCAGESPTSLTATGTNLKWYTAATGGVSLSASPSFSTQTATVLTFFVSQTDANGCESLRLPVSVSVVATPSVPTATSVALCQGAPGQFSTSIPNALWYTSATGGTGTPQPPVINNQNAGEQIVYVSQTINGCESPRVAVKAIVYPIPAPPTIPPSATLCQFSSASSLTANGLALSWYDQSGKLSGAPTPNTSLSGTQSYSVTQTINSCESPRTIVSVVITPIPAPPVANSTRFCVGETPVSLSATGSNLKWYTGSSGGIAAATSPIFSTQTSTVFTFYVSQTDASSCESIRQPVSVSIIATPSAPTVSSVSLCQGAQGQFSTSIPNALWYPTATGGIGSAQPPTLNNQNAGDQIVYITQTVNSCESPRTAVKATIYPIPAAPTAASTFLCQFSTPSPLSVVGSSLTWYNQSGKLAAAPTPSTSLAGTQSYSVSQTINTCESPRTTVNVVVRSAPSTPTASSIRYCIGDLPRSLTATGSNTKWYITPTGGTSSTTSPAFFTETATVYTFYVTQTDTNSCESLRQPVSVSVVAPPSAPTVTANQVVCQSSKASPLTASPNTGLIWQQVGVTGSSETAPTPVTSQPNAFTYLVTQKAGSCTSPPAQIVVTIAPAPVPPGVKSSVAFCIGDTPAPLSATGSNLTWYTNADRTGPSLTRVIPSTSQTSLTTYYVTQKDANNCESLNSVVEVRVSKRATATLSGDGYVYPGDSTAIRVRLTGDAKWTLQTSWSTNPIVITDPKDSLYVAWVHPAQTTTYTVTSLSTACGLGDPGNSYTIRVITPLSAQPTIEPLSVDTYPNPTTGDVSVNWSSPMKQTVTLQIVNALGVIVKQVIRQSTIAPQTEVFQMGAQPAGMYFLQLKTLTNGVLSRTIVKQ